MRLYNNIDGRFVKFISDIHYNHSSILKFDYPARKAWEKVEDMNQTLQEELRNSVGKNDYLIDLGDLFWKTKQVEAEALMSSLQYKSFFKIMGNHDSWNLWKRSSKLRTFCEGIGDILDLPISYEGRIYNVVLSHYPLVSWNLKARGSFMLHGHCHGNIDPINESSPDLRVDLGMDATLSRSLGKIVIGFPDILDYFKKKTGTDDFKTWSLTNCKNSL